MQDDVYHRLENAKPASAPQLQVGEVDESAAYKALTENKMLVNRYRVNPEEQKDVLDLIPANSSIAASKILGCCFCCCGLKSFVVNDGYVQLANDGSGGFPMFGPGVHLVCNPWFELGPMYEIYTTRITNGPHTICTIQQGHVGVCEDMGEPVLLPPGMHQWDSPTLKFHEEVDLSSNHVELGPYTIITCDEGYAAITTDNGKQIILDGGSTTMLTHRNWKFEEFMSMKFNSNDLKAIEATSADNVSLHVEATVVWHIQNPAAAARTAVDTMGAEGAKYNTIRMLADDVLKQARASLAMYIGELRYMDTFHLSSTIQEQRRNATKGAAAVTSAQSPLEYENATAPPEYSRLYDDERMAGCVAHANLTTERYGVNIVSINIISASPSERTLTEKLAQGALAAAEAEMTETMAHADAKAAKIKQDIANENMRAEAQARADSAIIEAEGQKRAADLIASSELACELQRLQAMKGVLSDKAAFFFGSDPAALSSVLSNPAMVQRN